MQDEYDRKMIQIVIDRKKAGQECAESAFNAGLITMEEIPRAAEEFSKLPLSELLSALIESAHYREGGKSAPPLKDRFSAN